MKKSEIPGHTKEELESGMNMLYRIAAKQMELTGYTRANITLDVNKELGGPPCIGKITATKTEHFEHMFTIGEGGVTRG